MIARPKIAIAATFGIVMIVAGYNGAKSGAAAADLTASQQKCLSAIKADVEAAKADVKLIAPTKPLDLKALKGKTIWYVPVYFNQFSSDWVAGLQEAADTAGVKLVTFDGQGSANRFNEGISAAVAQHAAGIIVAAIDPSVISASLAEAKAAGIPVMNGVNSDPNTPLPSGMYGNFTSDFTAEGATAAKWALLESGCTAHLVMLTSSSVAVWQNMAAGAKSAFDRYCPECSLKVLDIDIANIVTSIGSQLQTALQLDPGVDYILAAGDALVPFVSPVVATANSSAKVLGHDGLAASIDMIASRKGQDMTVAMPDFKWLGWLAFDDLGRAILGQARPGYVIPTRIIDATNIGNGSVDKLFPNYVKFREAFTRAWARQTG